MLQSTTFMGPCHYPTDITLQKLISSLLCLPPCIAFFGCFLCLCLSHFCLRPLPAATLVTPMQVQYRQRRTAVCLLPFGSMPPSYCCDCCCD